jgi:4-aminobutyrate aminotransferase-like enzyme/Ser/Thr protein kinase RdoA (MazF antagonist)
VGSSNRVPSAILSFVMEPPTSQSQADPLETPPPNFAPDVCEAVLERVFGLNGSIAPLDSERDQNFRVVTDDDRSFVLKISNRADDPLALDMQTEAMLHIARHDPDLPVMEPLRTTEGGYFGKVEGADGQSHLVRLFTFLTGRTVASSELRHRSLYSYGSMLARMGKALRGFFHPAGGYRILWDLKHTPDLRPLLEETSDATQRAILQQVLDRFDERARVSLPGLRAQLIHNDLTLDNVLLDEEHRVSGIVDFGDLTHTALICDLAIALVSLMWERSDPLDAARATIDGYTSVTPIEDVEAEILGDLVTARLAALIIIANWRVQRYPENTAYIMGSVEPAWRLLKHLSELTWSEVEKQMSAASAGAGSALSKPRLRPSTEELLRRRKQVLGPALSPLTYDRPLYLVRGRGSYMFDHQDRAYLDAYNNVPVVGHCHPRVSAAIADQSMTLNTNTRYLHESVVELAERLVSTMPQGLDTVMFFNSGSEANDIAWRLATAYTGGTGAIVTSYAYHGVTTATIALSPEGWPEGERPPQVETVPPPDDYRGAYDRGDPGWAERYSSHVDEALSALENRGMRPAAFFSDALFTSDGIFTPPPAYFERVALRLKEAGCLFIADEVQCGYGRTGAHMWSFQSSGVVPDFVTLGKPMGNGHPVAAVVTRSEVAERFAASTDMFSTFGGNPVASRAALAVLDVIEEERLMEHAHDVGRHLRAGLETLLDRHDSIGDIRGSGLLIGIDLVRDRETKEAAPNLAHAVLSEMRERGVLIGATGALGNVLKIRPPLVLSTSDADVITETLDSCLRALSRSARS